MRRLSRKSTAPPDRTAELEHGKILPLVLLFGCPPSAVDYAVDYLRIYACGTLFVMLAQGMNPFILTQGYSLFAMGTVLVGALVNIGLDPLFIFTLDMGVRGSSLATVLSQLCSCLCVLGFFFFKAEPVSPFAPAAGAAPAL